LQVKNHLLETNIAIIKTKVRQTRSKANQQVKIKSREMDCRISEYKQSYEEKVTEIEKEKTALAEEMDSDPVIYVNLNDELFESNLRMEHLSFHQVVEDVKSTFELELWRSLCRQTKYYLVTAEQTFFIFSKSDEIKDYSLIGQEWCKALDLEINKRLVIPFVDYIKGDKEEFLRLHRTGKRKNKPKYFSYLSRVVDDENYPEINALTLGQFHFALKESLKYEYSFKQFRQFIEEVFSDQKTMIPQLLLEKLCIVVNRYRNAIAHQSSMNKKEYQHLRELIFFGKESLLRICSIL
jgi:hypothetical protein